MSKYYVTDTTPPDKLAHAALVAEQVAEYLAAGKQIEQCPPMEYTWKLIAVEGPGDDVRLKKVKTLPEYMKGKKLAQETMQTPETPFTSVHRVTQAQARSRGMKTYWTGQPCRRGHAAHRYTRGGQCVVCHSRGFRSELSKKALATKEAAQKAVSANSIVAEVASDKEV